jgi:hypothetical protein
MLTSARPRTLVLVVSDVVIDVAMLGPSGRELGPRQVAPITTETATLWRAIDPLGEFDRITLVGGDRNNLGHRIARESQRPLRSMSHGSLHWSQLIQGSGVELGITLAPRFTTSLFHDGIEVPGIDVGWQLARKGKRMREYLACRVAERRGTEAWLRRVTRALEELLAVWSPTRLYLAAPSTVPMPEALPAQVVIVPSRDSLEDALLVWNHAPGAELPRAASPQPQ